MHHAFKPEILNSLKNSIPFQFCLRYDLLQCPYIQLFLQELADQVCCLSSAVYILTFRLDLRICADVVGTGSRYKQTSQPAAMRPSTTTAEAPSSA